MCACVRVCVCVCVCECVCACVCGGGGQDATDNTVDIGDRTQNLSAWIQVVNVKSFHKFYIFRLIWICPKSKVCLGNFKGPWV